MVPSLNSPLELRGPFLFLCLFDDVLLQRLSANSPHVTLTIVVQDGRYLVIASNMFLGRISGCATCQRHPILHNVLPTSKPREPLEPLRDRVCSTKHRYTSYQHRKQGLACERGRGMVLSRACCRVKALLYELMGRRNLILNDPGSKPPVTKKGTRRGQWFPCVNAQEDRVRTSCIQARG